jgi:hypothetical protein
MISIPTTNDGAHEMKTAAYAITDEEEVPLIRVPLLPPLKKEPLLDLAGWRERPPTIIAVPDGPLFRVLRPRDRGVLAAAKARLRLWPREAPDRLRVLVAREQTRARQPMMLAALPDVLTIREVAGVLRASEDFVWALIKRQLISMALGSKPLVRILKTDLIAFLQAQRVMLSRSVGRRGATAPTSMGRTSGSTTPPGATTSSIGMPSPPPAERAPAPKTDQKHNGPSEITSSAGVASLRKKYL